MVLQIDIHLCNILEAMLWGGWMTIEFIVEKKLVWDTPALEIQSLDPANIGIVLTK